MSVFFRNTLREAAAKVSIALLFAMLTANVAAEFLRTHHVTGLLLVGSEALVVVLTIVRRRARAADHSPLATLVTLLSVAGPPLLRPSGGTPLAPDAGTAMISALGLAIVIAGKITLGRSFGLIPANRGVVSRGPYSLMRHPIYAGYLLTHAAFLAAYPSMGNLVLLIVADTALVVRALREERVLQLDSAYRVYCGRVAWHLVPGVF